MRKIIALVLFLSGLLLLEACGGGMPFYMGRIGPWELGMVFLLPLSMGIYFLPSIIAAVRQKKKILGIVLLNALAGWTFVGWIVSLVWAFTADS